ncbi:type II secretion system GspH family protein [bacterium]|nr:type II secretion system GspH family protein [bacterium]
MQNKGFTLIELLVVIAIIGILAGIIIVSMGGAQRSANDAKIQATMDQMRTSAQIYYINHNSNYGTNSALATSTTCSTTELASSVGADANFNALCTSIATFTPRITVAANGASWCSITTLPGGGQWCVDSNGNAGKTAIACDEDTSTCAP